MLRLMPASVSLNYLAVVALTVYDSFKIDFWT